MSARCLSVHATYRCGHSGLCCSDVWTVPVESRVIDLVVSRGIRTAVAGTLPFVPVPGLRRPAGAMVANQHDGWCVFFEKDNGRLCAIHRSADQGALPSSCRHFPRIHLRDGRGVFIALSHFCPTAAALLLEDVPLRIVDAHAPLALDGDIEGMNAVDALPPLLRPGLLMDLEGHGQWEQCAIATLARGDLTHESALETITAAAESIRTWRPGGESLSARVVRAFEADRPPQWSSGLDDAARLDIVDRASLWRDVPLVTRASAADVDWGRFDAPIKRYLAARLFGNWIAYQGRGLRSVAEWLRICLAVLRNEIRRQPTFIEAVRSTDLTVLHRISSVSVARRLEPLEDA